MERLHNSIDADLRERARRVGGEERPTGLNTPEAIDLQRLFREMLDAGDRACVMEATSIAGAQGRLAGTRFAVLVFTNLTQDHLDFHRTMEAYYAAKRALFDQAERAVVNVGDDWGQRLARELPRARTFHPDDDLDGFDLHLRGAFNRANALGAIWAAREKLPASTTVTKYRNCRSFMAACR